jgi:hypothetical protein
MQTMDSSFTIVESLPSPDHATSKEVDDHLPTKDIENPSDTTNHESSPFQEKQDQDPLQPRGIYLNRFKNMSDDNVHSELNEDEKKSIVLSDSFLSFFDRSSRLIEKALYSSDSDYLKDYTVTEDGENGFVCEFTLYSPFYRLLTSCDV